MSKILTSSEVKKHNNRKSVWIVLKNDVYDVTAYLNEHPGGEDPLLDAAGMDATRAFEDVGHSDDARSLLKKYKIGSLAPGETCCTSSTSHRCFDDAKPWRSFDKPKSRSTSKSSLHKSRSKSPPAKKRGCKSPPPKRSGKQSALKKSDSKPSPPALLPKRSNISTSSPRVIPRVPSIIVPRSGSKWKWALLALAAAIIVGVAYKKYAS